MTKEIGDPLERAATTGKLGGSPASLTSKGSRKPHTLYLPPALSKWVKMQAVEEDREMSEIVTDALEIYRKLRG